MKNTYKETDLYSPVRALLTVLGFTVRGEVKGCDIAAVKDNTLWLIEMKLTANLKLLFQAAEKQTMTDWVFVAIPRPKKARDKHYTQFSRLLKKLNIGLITVSLDSEHPTAEIIRYPAGNDTKNNAAARKIKREIAGRTVDTQGGTQEKVNTAYREKCIKIAVLLEIHGPVNAPALIKTHRCGADTYNILRANTYGWYEKTGRGLFALSEQGRSYLHENSASNLVIFYRMRAAAAY
jgi:hypothetical protein